MRSQLPLKLISSIALIGTLSLMSGIPLLQATAAPARSTTELLDYAYPKSLSWRVRRDLARRVGIPAKNLRVMEAQRQTWRDACLELAAPDELCAQQLVEGWRIVVAHGQQTWTYHTDATGRSMRLESADRAVTLPRNVVFRSQSSGGFAGQSYETVLFTDGRVQQKITFVGGKNAPVRSWRVSPEKVREFQQLLDREQFQTFNQQTFPATPGAADFFVVRLTSPSSSVEYADIEQEKLPRSLKTVIQAWDSLR
ncbi:hypothetical protein ACQ4M3_26180 [Leptolyngbya sp. AN03gr2]|uniref:hypothetical protein n=1 Tax=unclassified Leptolyngbya TaxID=2650499 RepID=UPI003D319050